MAEGSLSGRVLVVDPGHNGANGSHAEEINRPVDAGGFTKACNTTGTSAGPYPESRFNWELALRVKQGLEGLGATVVLTRIDDEGWGPCIDERGLTAQRAGADLLLSLHADGAASAASGFHVIHPSNVPGFTEGVVGPSADLARHVRDALVSAGFRPADYVGTDGLDARGDLGTLNRAGVPAAMLEAGNMANNQDAAVLTSAGGQDRLAAALVDALVSYFEGP
jgi:N-acetylmuramoyl-L-alanine amidase